MAARLKLQEIDGRAPPGVEPAAKFDSTRGDPTGSRHNGDGQIGSSFLILDYLVSARQALSRRCPNPALNHDAPEASRLVSPRDHFALPVRGPDDVAAASSLKEACWLACIVDDFGRKKLRVPQFRSRMACFYGGGFDENGCLRGLYNGIFRIAWARSHPVGELDMICMHVGS